MPDRPHGDVMHYVMEFMRFLCGFSLMLAVSLTFLYLSTSIPSSTAFLHTLVSFA